MLELYLFVVCVTYTHSHTCSFPSSLSPHPSICPTLSHDQPSTASASSTGGSMAVDAPLATALDVCAALSSANAAARANLIRHLAQRRQLACELSHLQRAERLRWDHLISKAQYVMHRKRGRD